MVALAFQYVGMTEYTKVVFFYPLFMQSHNYLCNQTNDR